MTTPDVAAPSLQWMERRECLQMLSVHRVGRLAVIRGDTPVIFPVNYAVDGDDIVFRTDAGTKLHAGPRARACLEIDAIDPVTHSGWSVVVTGRLDEVTEFEGERWRSAHQLGLEPWAPGAKQHWMCLAADQVTGRRLTARP
jgi:nitroimidazol reductase NimA-like FMN-containing flavoprotein (pyridoxamine 5'-phosphate oxidase superfamily)